MQILKAFSIIFYRIFLPLLLMIVLPIGTSSASVSKQAKRVINANCGVLSLAHLMTQAGEVISAENVRSIVPSSARGHSIADLQRIASKKGFKLQGVRFDVGTINNTSLPIIVHLPVNADNPYDGHYCILEKADDRHIILFDPQSGIRFQMARTVFLYRWQGVALIAGRKIPANTRILDESIAYRTYGGYDTLSSNPSGSADYGSQSQSGNFGHNGNSTGSSPCGSPTWSVNMVNMNLVIEDIPLWYEPPIGPQVRFALTYNSKYPVTENEPLGRKWTLNYSSFLQENTTDGSVMVVLPDGKQELYNPDGTGGYTKGYKVNNKLEKLGTDNFRLTFPDGTVFIFQIPASSNATNPLLVEWQDVWGQVLTLSYNTDAQLISITDPVGNVSAITYTNGRITRVDDPFGRFAEFEYDYDGNLTKITDMGGYWTVMTYDSQGYIAEMENEKGKTLFYIEPSSTVATFDVYPAPGAAMQANYRITVTDPEGNKSEYYYCGVSGHGWYISPRHYMEYVDENNNNYASNVPKVLYYYANTIKGNREEIARQTFQEGTVIGFIYDYDTGLPTGAYDYEGNTIQFTYNDMGRVSSITPAAGLPVTYEYNPLNNVDLEHVVRQGLGTKNISYNNTHQVTQIVDEEGKITGPVTYDSYGRIETITETFDGHNVITEYDYYDPGVVGEFRLKQIIKDGTVVASYTYDAIGRVRTYTDSTGLTLTYDHNNLNHITRITYPDTKFIEYGYSSCCPRSIDYIIDRAGRTTTYSYDKMQRLISEHRPGVGYIRYNYDSDGNPIRITDANDHVTRFEYDNEDRLIRKYDANERFVTFSYNNNGLLEKRTNARGVETIYGYDENHNPVSVTYSDGTPGVTYGYDNYQLLGTITDALGAHVLIYYDNAWLESVDGPWADDTVSYTYDNLGRIKTTTPQGGRTRTRVYDNQGRLNEIIIGTATYSYGYQGVNPLVRSLSRPNSSQTTYNYDGLNRLLQISNKNSSDQILAQFDFQYNEQDMIGHETVTNTSGISGLTVGVTEYENNALNQVVSATNPSLLYSYDDDGNMVTGYTPAGHVFTAAYDANDRLNSIEYNDGSTGHRYEFAYGHDGFLGQVKRYENSTLVDDIRIVRDGFLTIQERDAANTVIREYSWGLNKGGGIGGLLAMSQGGQNYDYLYDGKGNVSIVIDNTQAVVASYRYDTFGRLVVISGALDQPYQFSTKRYFAGVGLSYYGYRYYSPVIGRWLNRDPLGEAGGLNLYGFVQNNPVNNIDPNGLNPAIYEFVADFAEGFLVPGPPPPTWAGAAGWWARDRLDAYVDYDAVTDSLSDAFIAYLDSDPVYSNFKYHNKMNKKPESPFKPGEYYWASAPNPDEYYWAPAPCK